MTSSISASCDPALGEPAAELGLGALLVPERLERELVGVLGHAA